MHGGYPPVLGHACVRFTTTYNARPRHPPHRHHDHYDSHRPQSNPPTPKQPPQSPPNPCRPCRQCPGRRPSPTQLATSFRHSVTSPPPPKQQLPTSPPSLKHHARRHRPLCAQDWSRPPHHRPFAPPRRATGTVPPIASPTSGLHEDAMNHRKVRGGAWLWSCYQGRSEDGQEARYRRAGPPHSRGMVRYVRVPVHRGFAPGRHSWQITC